MRASSILCRKFPFVLTLLGPDLAVPVGLAIVLLNLVSELLNLPKLSVFLNWEIDTNFKKPSYYEWMKSLVKIVYFGKKKIITNRKVFENLRYFLHFIWECLILFHGRLLIGFLGWILRFLLLLSLGFLDNAWCGDWLDDCEWSWALEPGLRSRALLMRILTSGGRDSIIWTRLLANSGFGRALIIINITNRRILVFISLKSSKKSSRISGKIHFWIPANQKKRGFWPINPDTQQSEKAGIYIICDEISWI